MSSCTHLGTAVLIIAHRALTGDRARIQALGAIGQRSENATVQSIDLTDSDIHDIYVRGWARTTKWRHASSLPLPSELVLFVAGKSGNNRSTNSIIPCRPQDQGPRRQGGQRMSSEDER